MQNTRRDENEMAETKKKLLRKRSKNQHLKLEIVSMVWFFFCMVFFHSLHSAVHPFIRSPVFCVNSAAFKMLLISLRFFSLARLLSVFRSFLFYFLNPFRILCCFTWLCNHFIRFALMTESSSFTYSFFCHNSFLFSISNLQNAFVFNRFCLRFHVKYVCVC